MDSLYIYLAIAGVLLIVFILNLKKNKSVQKDRKTRNFKKAYYDRKKDEKSKKS